jgi:DNA-binding Xre family transcriptional regulator
MAAAVEEKTVEDISAMMKMSKPTVRKYMRAPEKLPWETLCALCRKLNVPIEDLRECVRY